MQSQMAADAALIAGPARYILLWFISLQAPILSVAQSFSTTTRNLSAT